MKWLYNFLVSSIGQKVIMSLTGIFLILFLKVHLIGNLQLLYNDGGESFNVYAYFMTHNPVIKTISYSLYAFILLHAIQGLLLAYNNRQAKGSTYQVTSRSTSSLASRNMALLGTIVLAFIFIHMGDFWWKMKMGMTNMVTYDSIDYQVQDLYEKVSITFSKPLFVGFYVLGMIALAYHLLHGFQSAFQTLGLNQKRFTPIIKWVGWVFSIVVPALFALIPLYFYFNQ